MHNIDTQIEIKATREQVWAVLTDFEQYKEWNPFLVDIIGTLELGGTLKVGVHHNGHVNYFEDEISQLHEGHSFEWKGVLMDGNFIGWHSFRLLEQKNSSTVFQHQESFEGNMVKTVLKGNFEALIQNFHQMNKALKARVESLNI